MRSIAAGEPFGLTNVRLPVSRSDASEALAPCSSSYGASPLRKKGAWKRRSEPTASEGEFSDGADIVGIASFFTAGEVGRRILSIFQRFSECEVD